MAGLRGRHTLAGLPAGVESGAQRSSIAGSLASALEPEGCQVSLQYQQEFGASRAETFFPPLPSRILGSLGLDRSQEFSLLGMRMEQRGASLLRYCRDFTGQAWQQLQDLRRAIVSDTPKLALYLAS